MTESLRHRVGVLAGLLSIQTGMLVWYGAGSDGPAPLLDGSFAAALVVTLVVITTSWVWLKPIDPRELIRSVIHPRVTGAADGDLSDGHATRTPHTQPHRGAFMVGRRGTAQHRDVHGSRSD